MTLELILSASAYFDIPVEDLTARGRRGNIVRVRAAIAYVLRHRDKLSYPRIAARLGRSDHTTVIGALRRFDAQWRHDSDLMRWVNAQMASTVFPPAVGQVRLRPAVEKFTPEHDPDPDCPLILDGDGNSVGDFRQLRDIRRGSKRLLAALRAAQMPSAAL